MRLGWVETLCRQTTPITKSGCASAIDTAASVGREGERERERGVNLIARLPLG